MAALTSKQLVYCGSGQRGKRLTNDGVARVSMIRDGITMGRTDGALGRFTPPVSHTRPKAAARARLLRRMRRALKDLPRCVPL